MVNISEGLLLHTQLNSEQIQLVEKFLEHKCFLEVFYQDIHLIFPEVGPTLGRVVPEATSTQLPFSFTDNSSLIQVGVTEKGNPVPGLGDLLEFAAGEGCRNYPESYLVPDGVTIIDACGEQVFTNDVARGMAKRLGIENVSFLAMLQKLQINSPQLLGFLDQPVFIGHNLQIEQYELGIIVCPLFSEGKFVGGVIILSDLTLIRKKEKELIKKATVIKEIHHRVKNNLQTITSLLRLQMRRIKSDKVEKALNESINRILSISLIHEALSHQELEVINIKQTIYKIMDMILDNMVASNKVIRGEILGEDVYLTAQQASSLALCVTELIQNAIEHAFVNRTEGLIRITVETRTGDLYVTVQDNGAGISADGIEKRSSLGMQIVETMTRNTLNGRFSIEGSRAGTIATIAFTAEIKEGGDSE